jgi:hypothetical protein
MNQHRAKRKIKRDWGDFLKRRNMKLQEVMILLMKSPLILEAENCPAAKEQKRLLIIGLI